MDMATHTCPNERVSDGNGLSMDTERAGRFTSALARINWAVHSLEMATKMFPRYGVESGHMEPVSTVLSFAKSLDADIQLLYRMIENEEGEEESREILS